MMLVLTGCHTISIPEGEPLLSKPTDAVVCGRVEVSNCSPHRAPEVLTVVDHAEKKYRIKVNDSGHFFARLPEGGYVVDSLSFGEVKGPSVSSEAVTNASHDSSDEPTYSVSRALFARYPSFYVVANEVTYIGHWNVVLQERPEDVVTGAIAFPRDANDIGFTGILQGGLVVTQYALLTFALAGTGAVATVAGAGGATAYVGSVLAMSDVSNISSNREVLTMSQFSDDTLSTYISGYQSFPEGTLKGRDGWPLLSVPNQLQTDPVLLGRVPDDVQTVLMLPRVPGNFNVDVKQRSAEAHALASQFGERFIAAGPGARRFQTGKELVSLGVGYFGTVLILTDKAIYVTVWNDHPDEKRFVIMERLSYREVGAGETAVGYYQHQDMTGIGVGLHINSGPVFYVSTQNPVYWVNYERILPTIHGIEEANVSFYMNGVDATPMSGSSYETIQAPSDLGIPATFEFNQLPSSIAINGNFEDDMHEDLENIMQLNQALGPAEVLRVDYQIIECNEEVQPEKTLGLFEPLSKDFVCSIEASIYDSNNQRIAKVRVTGRARFESTMKTVSYDATKELCKFLCIHFNKQPDPSGVVR